MATKYFHFSLGPVQGFIAQARRTRDFWAGSFILSWLSAVAMKAVEAQDGTIDFPKPDDDYLLWLVKDKAKSVKPPEHGSVPNRFKASIHDGFKPEAVIDSVNQAWIALADKVYEGDLARTGDKTKQIWKRQVESYWDMSWVITDDESDSSALDVRKNWRSYLPPEEEGVKCMMMDGWQELSGIDKPNAKELGDFWKGIRENAKQGIKTDLRENECLCAIAFIKRRFSRYFYLVDKAMPNGWILAGWEVQPGRPSVAYMAAVHWLEKVFDQTIHYPDVTAQLWLFHDAASELTDGNYNEWDNKIRCIQKYDISKKWKALDGNVFFETALENVNIYEDQTQAKKVLNELKELQRLMPDLKNPTPFYAVLMMDGDSLGKQMSDADKQATITKGLAEFTASVPDLVHEHNGFLIYAGGDDVLAVLPLEDALDCALAIREKYTRIFEALNEANSEKPTVSTSISAAIQFAHIKMPLMKVLKDAHDLLDKVAKDKYGRDTLAVRVWKPGGMVLEWAMPWERAIELDDDGKKCLVLKRLADDFSNDDDAYGQLSNKFLYKIRERFELLNPPQPLKGNGSLASGSQVPAWEPDSVLDADQAIDLMAAEYFSSGMCDQHYKPSQRLEHARAVVKPLLTQCRPVYRALDADNSVTWDEAKDIKGDAALLVRFLAQKGVNV